VILKLLRIECRGLSGNDVLRQIEHVLRNFHVLDLVEVFLLVPDFVRVAEKCSHQTLLQGLSR
jgi:hypothetical protein